jgi:hypothetical protein
MKNNECMLPHPETGMKVMDHQLTIRVPADLMNEIIHVSQLDDRSINKTVVLLLKFGVIGWHKEDQETTRAVKAHFAAKARQEKGA